jgi:hypothetical protein
MGSYSILVPGIMAADNMDNLVKSAKSAVAVERGNIVSLGALSSTAGEHEVFVAATPATASLETAIYYMVTEPAVVVTDGKYKGLTDDESDFNVAIGKVFDVSKPKIGDEIILTDEGLAGTKSSNTFIIPADNTPKLTWGASATGVSLAYELIETTYVTVPSSTFYSGRKTAYKFRCVKAQ